jgi:hypothetical protein
VRPRGADIPNRELKTKLIVQLCECYASEMADHLTTGEVLDFDGEISPTGHAKMKAAAEVCEPDLPQQYGNPSFKNTSPGQLGTDRDQGFDTSVAAPNAKQGRAATVFKLSDSD